MRTSRWLVSPSRLHLAAAQVQIDGERLVVDRMEGSAGKVEFAGDYRYEPTAVRPHRVHLRGEIVGRGTTRGAAPPHPAAQHESDRADVGTAYGDRLAP